MGLAVEWDIVADDEMSAVDQGVARSRTEESSVTDDLPAPGGPVITISSAIAGQPMT
jgi:hypothetical protein